MEVSKKVRNFASLLTGKGRLAQLVQSVCLTSRGSGVRIPQRPQQKLILSKRSRKVGILIPIIGRLAQLVQSVCLTSRGSGVRIPQRPHQATFSRWLFSYVSTDTSHSPSREAQRFLTHPHCKLSRTLRCAGTILNNKGTICEQFYFIKSTLQGHKP